MHIYVFSFSLHFFFSFCFRFLLCVCVSVWLFEMFAADAVAVDSFFCFALDGCRVLMCICADQLKVGSMIFNKFVVFRGLFRVYFFHCWLLSDIFDFLSGHLFSLLVFFLGKYDHAATSLWFLIFLPLLFSLLVVPTVTFHFSFSLLPKNWNVQHNMDVVWI